MKPATEKWTSDVLKSLDGLQRAAMPETLAFKILQNRQGKSVSLYWLRSPAVWMAAASLALLITLNVFTCISFSYSGRANPSVATEYFGYTQILDL